MNCKNVVNAGDPDDPEVHHLLEGDEDGYLVDISCVDRARFDGNTDADIWRDFDAVATAVAAGCSKARREVLEMSRGITYSPHGILADIPLRQIFKPSTTTRDPMHVVLANGVMNVEIYLLLEGFRREIPNFTYKTMGDYVSCDWRFPRKAASLTFCFTEAREKIITEGRLIQSISDGAFAALSNPPTLCERLCVAVWACHRRVQVLPRVVPSR